MLDKKNVNANENENEKEEKVLSEELDLDTLENVSGGSLRNVKFTKTVDISEDTRSKI